MPRTTIPLKNKDCCRMLRTLMTDISTTSAAASTDPVALIFDLDGTLVHSIPDLTHALNRLLAEHDRPAVTGEEVALMVGDGARVLVQRAWAHTGTAAGESDLDRLTDRFVAIYETATAGETQPYPGVVATLETLAARGHPLAVCTNKPHGATLKLLEELDLARFFPVVIGGGSTPDRQAPARPGACGAGKAGGAGRSRAVHRRQPQRRVRGQGGGRSLCLRDLWLPARARGKSGRRPPCRSLSAGAGSGRPHGGAKREKKV